MIVPIARRFWLLALCAAVLALGAGAAPARGDPIDPLFVFYASEAKEGSAHKPYPPPGTGFEGPCGLAVDSFGEFYVSDYYHHNVDVFKSSREYRAQLPGEDPIDGPCGLAVDAAGNLYVNNFHRDVVRFTPSSFPPASVTPYGAATTIDAAHPTGVAVDPGTGNVYVNDRTYIAVYEPSGAPVLDEGVPLRIGLGSLGDGYGVAVSAFPATDGYLYVPDAADDTVKVYDPAVDPVNPVGMIDGLGTPEGEFVSLRDAAVAVDQSSGRVYVADNLQPEYFERPEAAIYAFGASGAYAGRLKFNVIDAQPPGLAVDSATGRIYVTSGNSEGAAVYAYAPGALTAAVFPAAGLGVPPVPTAAGGEAQPPAMAPSALTAVTTGSPPLSVRPRGKAATQRRWTKRRRRAKHRRRARHEAKAKRRRGRASGGRLHSRRGRRR